MWMNKLSWRKFASERTEHNMLRLGCPNMFYYVNLNSLEREKGRGEKVEGFFSNIKKKFARNSHTWVTNKSTFIAAIKKKKESSS